MKNIIILVSFLWAITSYAVAPYGIKGQQQAATLYSNVHQFPNNQVTNLGGINALVETGNTNILSNPSFEHSTFSTSWTNSAGTFTQEASVVIDGKASAKLVLAAQTMSLTQSSTLYAAQFADGVQGLAMVRIKSDIALSVCSIQAGTVSTTNCVTTNTDSKWGLYKIPFVMGATSQGVSIASTGSVTGTVYVDDCFVGVVDLKQDINNVGPWTTFTPTGSWSTNTTYTGKYRQVGENLEMVYNWTTSGAPTSAALTLNMPTGFTIDTSKFPVITSETALDATGNLEDSGSVFYDIKAYYVSSTVIQPVAKNAANTYLLSQSGITQIVPFTWAAADSGDLFVKVPVTQFAGASSVYTAQNANTGRYSCGHTTSDFIGFGTVTAIETFCERDGEYLIMDGKFVSGTSTNVEARVNLKLGGATLTSASTVKIPTIQLAGQVAISVNSSSFFGNAALREPSVSYITFGQQSSTTHQLTKGNGSFIFGTGTTISFSARIPINGWENSNVIIGTFNEVVTSPGISKPKTCQYAFGGASATLATPTVCSTGTCVEVFDSCGSVTPPAFTATGVYTGITFTSGTFANSSPIECRCVSFNAASASVDTCTPYWITGSTGWSSNSSGGHVLNTASATVSGATQNTYVMMTCQGQAP